MNEKIYELLGEAIRRHRDAIGMTQAALGDKVGLGRTSVTNIENGKQKILLHHFLELAYALRVSGPELLVELQSSSLPQNRKDNSDAFLSGLVVRLDKRGGAR